MWLAAALGATLVGLMGMACLLRLFAGEFPLYHWLMTVLFAAITVYCFRYRHCFDWDG